MSDISVVIPAFNHAKYLAEAVDSVLSSPTRAEVIIIDDGSSDDTELIATRYKKEVHYVRQSNSGAHQAINRGIEMADTEYVAILNDDDLYQPWHLPNALKKIHHEQADVVLCRPEPFGFGPLLPQARNHEIMADAVLARFGPSLGLFFLNWFVGTSGIVTSRSAWTALGGFRELRLAHDLDYALRAMGQPNLRVCASLDRTWLYRCHSLNTVSGISPELAKREITNVLGPHIENFQQLGLTPKIESQWGFSLRGNSEASALS